MSSPGPSPRLLRPSVGFDNHEAARRLTLHLLDLGHRQIGVVAGRTYRNDRAASRVAGIRKALAERGLALPQEHLLERPYRIAEGQLALRALIATGHRPRQSFAATISSPSGR